MAEQQSCQSVLPGQETVDDPLQLTSLRRWQLVDKIIPDFERNNRESNNNKYEDDYLRFPSILDLFMEVCNLMEWIINLQLTILLFHAESLIVDLPPAPDPPSASSFKSSHKEGETDLRAVKSAASIGTLEPVIEEWYHGDLPRKQASSWFSWLVFSIGNCVHFNDWIVHIIYR